MRPIDIYGLYTLRGSQRINLPLEGVHVAVRIVDLVAEVQIVQFYVNSEMQPIDCIYEFPVDEKAAVCGFEAELPDRLLVGEVRERHEARAEYEAAVRRGETAALLEQKKTDIFRQELGNIPAGERINIRVTYVTELRVEADGSARFLLPTGVAPRYSPHPTWVPFWQGHHWHHFACRRRVCFDPRPYRECPWRLPCVHWPLHHIPQRVVNRERPCAFSINLEVESAAGALTVIESPTHSLEWTLEDGGQRALGTLWHETEPMGKDLVVRFQASAPHEPRVELEVAPDGSAAAMLTLVPDFDSTPEPVEIVILVDCSGSMSGGRIQAAAKALGIFLRSLPASCHFNIVRFGSSYKSLFAKSQPYTEHSFNAGLQVSHSLSANLGGTEIARPLKDIFNSPPAIGRSRQVFVLTDGQVSNTAQVIELCRQHAAQNRVFTVGIGDAVSHALVDGMARAASGTSEYILGRDATNDRALNSKLVGQLKIATLPALSKVEINWRQLGSAEPPPYPGPEVDGEPRGAAPAAASTGSENAGDSGSSVVRVTVDCDSTQPGERVVVVNESVGWDPARGYTLSTSEAQFPVWKGDFKAPSGTSSAFKFVIVDGANQARWEPFPENRLLNIPSHTAELSCEAGKFGVLSDSRLSAVKLRVAPPEGAPAVATTSSRLADHAAASRVFPTGPAAAGRNLNAVGSGPLPDDQLLPVAHGDVSVVQAAGRNDAVYQAPFLPPPVFSGAKFLMFAFFAAGHVPQGSVEVTAVDPAGGEYRVQVPVTKCRTIGRTVHTLAARALIRDLEEKTSHLHYRRIDDGPKASGGGGGVSSFFKGVRGIFEHGHGHGHGRGASDKSQDKASAWNLEPANPSAVAVRNEIIDLGVRFQLASSETSFVAVQRFRDGRSGSAFEPPPLPSEDEVLAPPQAVVRSRKSMAKPGGGRGGGGFGGFGAPPPLAPSAAAPPMRAMQSAPQQHFDSADYSMLAVKKKKSAPQRLSPRAPVAKMEMKEAEEACLEYSSDEDDDEEEEADAGMSLMSEGKSLQLNPQQQQQQQHGSADQIVQLQKFDGSFALDDKLAKATGVPSFDGVAAGCGLDKLGLSSGDADKALACALVIAALDKKFGMSEQFEMLILKTRGVLVQLLSVKKSKKEASLAADRLIDEIITFFNW